MGGIRARVRPVPSRARVVVLLLVATLALVGVLAAEAARAARAERRTAEAVLRDHAALAAWQYGQALRQSVTDAITTRIASLAAEDSRGNDRLLDPPAGDCGCPEAREHVRAFFHADLATNQWRTWGAPVPPSAREIVAASRRSAGGLESGVRLRLLDAEGGLELLAWEAPRSDGAVVHGMLAAPALLDAMLDAADARATLLPPALVDPAELRGLVALDVLDARGRVLRAGQAPASAFAAREDLGADLGGLVVHVALAPEAASCLIIGGLPGSRLPWLYGLAAVAAALTVLAVVQVRREAELARLRGEFISGVSHELRTPLAQIRMFAETLRLGRVRTAEEGTRSLDIILQESQRLSRLVDNVLSFSRAERGPLALARVPVPVDSLIDEVADSMQPVARAAGSTLRRGTASGCQVRADAGALRQVLLNLVDNALKYGPAGQTVTAGATACDGGVRLWVEDQGPGVAAEHAALIWQPFWRSPDAVQGGSGIGLAIVAELVSLHRGRAFVERARAGGARFVVELPTEPRPAGDASHVDAGPARQPA